MLNRYKSFVATGVATLGRLYAGDLNAIQDIVAAYSDYNQRVDVQTLGIGETGLALTHYGSGEARLSGALRTDGIVRALGGLFAGQFTTTQRDAITAGAGLTPYGLVIFNTTTNRYEFNKGNDTTRNWQPLSGINVSQAGTFKGAEGGINLIGGSGITLTITDNPGSGNVDITIAAPPAGVAGTIPIGGTCGYGGTSDPTNFLICDGRSLATAGTYNALFQVIGYTFGGSGANFNIPDERGRAEYGANASAGTPLAGNEGAVGVANRGPDHYHMLGIDLAFSSDSVIGGTHLAPGHSPSNTYVQVQAGPSGGTADSGGWIGMNKIIRYQ